VVAEARRQVSVARVTRTLLVTALSANPRTHARTHAVQSCDFKYVNIVGSVAEWLACWTQAQKGPGSNRSRDAVG